MATSIFGCTAISGGADGALDSILIANLSNGDIALVIDSNEEFLIYRFKSGSTTEESSPTFIRPDDYATAPLSPGVWHLTDQTQDVITIYGGIVMIDGTGITWDQTPGTDHTCTGWKVSATAGENLVFGNMCYLKSDGKYWKADADASGTMPVTAMAAATISADTAGVFLRQGWARDDTLTNTVGGKIFASTTAGGQTQTAPSGSGDQVQVIGLAEHADYFYFNPSLDVLELT
jgi:hypothetical protein